MKRRFLAALVSLAVLGMGLSACTSQKADTSGGSGELNIFVWTEYLPDSVVISIKLSPSISQSPSPDKCFMVIFIPLEESGLADACSVLE